jgi:aquaglyceroporin related protein
MAGHRQHTAADFRPPPLKQNASTASSIGRYNSARLENQPSTRPITARTDTAPMRIRRTGTSRTNQTNRSGGLIDAGERAEKKHEQTVDVANEYFALNPWYNQQKEKPVFGLASPLPRTVRKGMFWGKGGAKKSLYRIDESQNTDGIERHDGLDFQKNLGKFILEVFEVFTANHPQTT